MTSKNMNRHFSPMYIVRMRAVRTYCEIVNDYTTAVRRCSLDWVLPANGCKYIRQHITVVASSAPHVFIQVIRQVLSQYAIPPLEQRLARLPSALDIICMTTSQGIDVPYCVIYCFMWITKCWQAVVGGPFVRPDACAGQDHMLDDWY